jgi:hypothetical protein
LIPLAALSPPDDSVKVFILRVPLIYGGDDGGGGIDDAHPQG